MAQRDAALVGDDNDFARRSIERGDCGFDAGENLELVPAAYIFAFRQLAIDNPVAIEEDVLSVRKGCSSVRSHEQFLV